MNEPIRGAYVKYTAAHALLTNDEEREIQSRSHTCLNMIPSSGEEEISNLFLIRRFLPGNAGLDTKLSKTQDHRALATLH